MVKQYGGAARDVAPEKQMELVEVYRAFERLPEPLEYFPTDYILTSKGTASSRTSSSNGSPECSARMAIHNCMGIAVRGDAAVPFEVARVHKLGGRVASAG